MAAPSLWDDDGFGDFGEDYDAFFSAEGTPAPATCRAPQATLMPKGSDIESEYSFLSRGQSPTRGDAPAGTTAGPEGVTSFALDDDDSDDLDTTAAESEYVQDCRVPELPDPPAGFTAEDRQLREALVSFYLGRCSQKLGSVNTIVEQYRGRAVPHLWVQLALRYKLSTPDVVEHLSGTLYFSTLFEHLEESASATLGSTAPLPGAMTSAEGRDDLLLAWLEGGLRGVALSECALRSLSFRGLPEGCPQLRAQLWKVLLGYLPAQPQTEWPSIQAERRARYASLKAKFLSVSEDRGLEAKGDEEQQVLESVGVLQQIQKDVSRTQHKIEFFRRPATQVSLASLLLVYAHMNPEVQYIQGMNEVAAVVLHVMFLADVEGNAEADAFWCFSLLMQEIQREFVEALNCVPADVVASPTAPSKAGAVDRSLRMLRLYDPELAEHLQKAEVPVDVLIFRWRTVMFAQDVPLADVARLWDVLLGDPHRFEFLGHAALAALTACRERLLAVSEQGELAELAGSSPRSVPLEVLIARARAVCALERRTQTPPFPMRSAAQLVQDLSGWARQGAAALRPALRPAASMATELAASLGTEIVQKASPAVKERVGQASGKVTSAAKAVMASAPGAAQAVITSAPAAAHGGVHAVANWFNEPTPIKPETVEKAGAAAASLWQAVRTRGVEAVSKAQLLAASEQAESARATLGTAVDAAATASSAAGGAVFARLVGALTEAGSPASAAQVGVTGEQAAERPRTPYHAA